MLRGLQQTLVLTSTQRPHRDGARCAFECFECLLRRHKPAVACCGERGSGCSRPGRCGVWHKPSWRRSSLAQPQSRQAEDPWSREQLYQRSSRTAAKALGPTTDFPTWEIWQRDWKSPGNLTLKDSGVWLQNCHKTGWTVSWRAQAGSRRKEHWPHNRLRPTCLWVSRSLWQKRGSKVASHGVKGTEYNSPGSLNHLLLLYWLC